MEEALYSAEHMELLSQIVLILALFGALHLVLHKIGIKIHGRAKTRHAYWKQSFVEGARGPFASLIWLFALSLILLLILPKEFVPLLLQLRYLIAILLVVWFCFKWKKRAMLLLVKTRDKQADLVAKLTGLLIILIAVLLILDALGLNLQALIAIGGISGFSLGFASKDVLANLFSGFMLHITRPFVIEDIIKLDEKGIEGTVEAISWYYTSIRTPNKRLVYIPNSLFSTLLVTNISRMTHWNICEVLGIRYKDISAVPQIVTAIKKALSTHPAVDAREPIRVHLDKFNQSSLDIEVWFCIFATSKDEVVPIKQEILLLLAEIVASHEAEFAYPTLTILS